MIISTAKTCKDKRMMKVSLNLRKGKSIGMAESSPMWEWVLDMWPVWGPQLQSE